MDKGSSDIIKMKKANTLDIVEEIMSSNKPDAITVFEIKKPVIDDETNSIASDSDSDSDSVSSCDTSSCKSSSCKASSTTSSASIIDSDLYFAVNKSV